MKKIKIAAGLAHVDYGQLVKIVKEASDAGVDYIHSDAADMHDLKNMTFNWFSCYFSYTFNNLVTSH